MKASIIITLVVAAWPSGAGAFWQRSHWAACNEAPLAGERLRLNCHVFVPAHDWPRVDDWPLVGDDSRRSVRLPAPPRIRK